METRFRNTTGYILLVPAFAAVFFDFMVASLTPSILRIAVYNRSYLEPCLRDEHRWTKEHPLWDSYHLGRKDRMRLRITAT